MTKKWEYRIVRFEMPEDWALGAMQWNNLEIKHYHVLNKLGQQGWEYMMNIGPLFYFKRPLEEYRTGGYTGIRYYEEGL